MFNVVVVIFVHSVAPSLRHSQAVLLYILFVIVTCVYVYVCVHTHVHVECTCVRMCTCRMCGDVDACAMVHIKVKGTTSGIGPCLMPGLRWSACAWLLLPSPHRNTSTADTQWCAWIFVGPGESVLCVQGKQLITELSSQPGTALLCTVTMRYSTIGTEGSHSYH